MESQGEQLQLKVRTLQLDWETEQKRCVSYFNQIMELEKERDQVSVRGEGLARAWNYGSHSLPCPTQSVAIPKHESRYTDSCAALESATVYPDADVRSAGVLATSYGCKNHMQSRLGLSVGGP